MTARNSPCPCGSGRKYKHCHGRAPGSLPAANPQQQLEAARALARAGQLDAALEAAGRLPPGPPRSELTVQVLLARRTDGDLGQAGRVLAQWARQVPDHAEPWYRRIEWGLLAGDHAAANAAWKEAQRRAPDAANTHYFGALLAQLEGRLDEALSGYQQAIRVASTIPLDSDSLALEAAIQVLETAAGEYPGAPPGLDTALVDRVQERELLRRGLEDWAARREEQDNPPPITGEQRTRYANAWYNLGCSAMVDFGRVDEALETFQRAVAIEPDHELARLNHAFMLNYSDRHDADAVAEAHIEAGRWLRQRHGAPGRHFANEPDPDRPLRVGYLSSDFRSHSVAHFILPVLEAHDRTQVQSIVYYTDQRRDTVTARTARAAHRFRHVAALDDDALWRQVRADRVDILVDLNGLTRGHRVDVLVRRAAPIQGHWLGYPNTTGLDSMDFRIVDAVTDPPGAADERSSESLLRLVGPFSVYEAPPELPEPAAEAPHRAAGPFTFGCFNHLPKLSPSLLQAWARILEQTPV
ncbi:MAG: SEC-C metal-binding domain-containing protein, partial [Xanthomonadales bacterium]|nr:SEC-C metal-binding domain-containing protein [Xanthomonadales bacterium]